MAISLIVRIGITTRLGPCCRCMAWRICSRTVRGRRVGRLIGNKRGIRNGFVIGLGCPEWGVVWDNHYLPPGLLIMLQCSLNAVL